MIFVFRAWVLSLRIISSSSIHFAANNRISLLKLNNNSLCVYTFSYSIPHQWIFWLIPYLAIVIVLQ